MVEHDRTYIHCGTAPHWDFCKGASGRNDKPAVVACVAILRSHAASATLRTISCEGTGIGRNKACCPDRERGERRGGPHFWTTSSLARALQANVASISRASEPLDLRSTSQKVSASFFSGRVCRRLRLLDQPGSLRGCLSRHCPTHAMGRSWS